MLPRTGSGGRERLATLKEKKADLSSAGPSVHDGQIRAVIFTSQTLTFFFEVGGFGSPKVPAQEELFHFVNFALAPFGLVIPDSGPKHDCMVAVNQAGDQPVPPS